jgi:UDP-3-O-acyl N-acetylglucosamine deacetylase
MAKGRILIVDDETSIVRSLEGILADEGFDVVQARDGEAALALLQAQPCDLVLLDLWMPGMDGIQTLQRLKAMQTNVYIIVMSGHGNIETAVKATRLGAFDYLEKPLSLDNVLSSVNAAFEHLWTSHDYQRGVMGRTAEAPRNASLKEARRTWERQYLLEQLRQHQGDAARAAQALQLNERSLQRRLQLLGIRRSEPPHRVTMPQRTLQRSVVIHGQGLQSGVKTGMILSPLPINSGILFGDIASGETIPAAAAHVESTGYATTLRRGLVMARTVEHIMAALHMYRLTNVLVKIGGEVPFMDGSARDFCQLIEAAGVEEQAAEAPLLKIGARRVWGEEGPDQKHFVMEPASDLTITYHLRYPPPIGRQQFTFVADSPEHFKTTIAPARTFGFVKEIEHLHALGMANGGRLTNVILVDESRIINTDLRFPDEFARHKVLDLLGDLYLTGKFVQGKITAYMTGHTENLALVKFLLSMSGET